MTAPARETRGSKWSKKTNDGSYGLSAELKRKQDAKYDHGLEGATREWMESVLGKKLKGSFHEALKSGVQVCRLINKLYPKTIKKISKSKMPFNQMGNISVFLTACRKKGLPEHCLFSTVDLFEAKNMGQVLTTLNALRKKVGGRKLKVKDPKEKMGNLTGFDASIHDVKGYKTFDRNTGGADAAAGLLERDDPKDEGICSPSVRRASRNSAKRRSRKFVQRAEGYDGSYGLSAEVRAKMDAKYDYELEEVIQEWIEDVLGIEFEEPFAETLQSGVVLCQLINEVEGKHKRIPAKKISKSSQKFSQMGNINLFLDACRQYGLSEHSMFSTVDLVEMKNMMAVLITLDALRRGGTGGRKEPIRQKQYASQFDPSIRRHKGTAITDKINKNITYGDGESDEQV